MFGPYRVSCVECEFETTIEAGDRARYRADLHRERNDHSVVVTCRTSGREYVAGAGRELAEEERNRER